MTAKQFFIRASPTNIDRKLGLWHIKFLDCLRNTSAQILCFLFYEFGVSQGKRLSTSEENARPCHDPLWLPGSDRRLLLTRPRRLLQHMESRQFEWLDFQPHLNSQGQRYPE